MLVLAARCFHGRARLEMLRATHDVVHHMISLILGTTPLVANVDTMFLL